MIRKNFLFVRPKAVQPAGRPGADLITPLPPIPNGQPSERQEPVEIRTPLVEEQETTRHLGGKRRRLSLGDLGKAAGFLL